MRLRQRRGEERDSVAGRVVDEEVLAQAKDCFRPQARIPIAC
jgi:hypothetical protein